MFPRSAGHRPARPPSPLTCSGTLMAVSRSLPCPARGRRTPACLSRPATSMSLRRLLRSPCRPPRGASLPFPRLRRRLGFGLSGLFGGIGSRRRLLSGVLLVAGLPLLTCPGAGQAAPEPDRRPAHLPGGRGRGRGVGGFWPAVLAAVPPACCSTGTSPRPLHTFTIDDRQNLLALLLFVTVAVTVSSVVHLAARRAVQAARSREEAASCWPWPRRCSAAPTPPRRCSTT